MEDGRLGGLVARLGCFMAVQFAEYSCLAGPTSYCHICFSIGGKPMRTTITFKHSAHTQNWLRFKVLISNSLRPRPPPPENCALNKVPVLRLRPFRRENLGSMTCLPAHENSLLVVKRLAQSFDYKQCSRSQAFPS